MPSRYEQVYDGDWWDVPKNFDLACCHCSLVHGVSFRIRVIDEKPILQIRMNRNMRATAALRRHKKRR
jgi:hypothetical protein